MVSKYSSPVWYKVSKRVYLNEEMAAMMVYQTDAPGMELYFYASTLFCFSDPIWLLVTCVKILHSNNRYKAPHVHLHFSVLRHLTTT